MSEHTEMIKFLHKENRKYGPELVLIPRHRWNPTQGIESENWRTSVWRSRQFLVQVFNEPDRVIRITVNRTMIDNNGNWLDGITWDELQHIKAEIGFALHTAIEVYPPHDRKVNVANMRHLWILPDVSKIPVWGLNRES